MNYPISINGRIIANIKFCEEEINEEIIVKKMKEENIPINGIIRKINIFKNRIINLVI